MKRRNFAISCGVLTLLTTKNWAADFLFRQPLKIVVPAAPGGFTDIAARLVGEKLALRTGNPVVIDNKAGASGMIGSEAVARSAPDGGTIVMGNIQTHAANSGLFKNMTFDVMKDFSPITRVAMGYNILVVPQSSPVKSLAGLIDLAKKQPKTISFGTGGSGSSAHLASEMFSQRAGVELLHIPYRSNAPAAQALVAGQISMMFDTIPGAIAQIRAGNLRALAVTSPQRLATLPEIPTIAETLAGFEVAVWGGLYAPTGTPERIIQAIDKEVQDLLKEPALIQRFDQLGFNILPLGPKEFSDFTKSEIAKWGQVIRLGKITAT